MHLLRRTGNRSDCTQLINLGSWPGWLEPGRLGDVAMARLPKLCGFVRFAIIVVGFIGNLAASITCVAYTAAGDRIFAPTGILPQIAPTNQIYSWAWTLPQSGEAVGTR